MTFVPDTASERHLPVNSGFHFNIEDFDDLSVSRSSFRSIHFGRSSSPGEEADSASSGEDGGDDFASLFTSSHSKSQLTGVNPSQTKKSKSVVPTSPAVSRTLYIQMVRMIHLEVETCIALSGFADISP